MQTSNLLTTLTKISQNHLIYIKTHRKCHPCHFRSAAKIITTYLLEYLQLLLCHILKLKDLYLQDLYEKIQILISPILNQIPVMKVQDPKLKPNQALHPYQRYQTITQNMVRKFVIEPMRLGAETGVTVLARMFRKKTPLIGPTPAQFTSRHHCTPIHTKNNMVPI